MRRALIIGNWKMHKTVAQAVEFARTLSAGFSSSTVRSTIEPTGVGTRRA